MFKSEKPWRLFLSDVGKQHDKNLELKRNAGSIRIPSQSILTVEQEQIIAAETTIPD